MPPSHCRSGDRLFATPDLGRRPRRHSYGFVEILRTEASALCWRGFGSVDRVGASGPSRSDKGGCPSPGRWSIGTARAARGRRSWLRSGANAVRSVCA